MGLLVSKWREEYAQRLNWAERAYQDFLENIDPELARYFSPQEKEASVVLFGKTQVGKTTLLLKLMGVRDEVAKLLRGGQGRGKSATATAIRYSESPDDFWRLKDDQDDEQILDDSSLEEKLRNLRQRVESGNFRSDRPVEIKIPLKYFDDQNNRLFRINILDLPGENARNEWEAAHVKRVAQKYVPIADLILLVGRGDDLSFLKSDSLSIPEIEDWRYTPDRFRIITTYSTRADSFIDWLNTLTNPTKACFRRRLLEQIETHDYQLPDETNSNSFFPLEYGDSWNALKEKEADLYLKVKPVIDGLFEELFENISSSATPHSRIMSAAKLYVVAEKHKLKKRAIYENDIKNFKNNIEGLTKTLDVLKIKLDNVLEMTELLIDEKNNLCEFDFLQKCEETFVLEKNDSDITMKVSSLCAYLTEKKEELISKFSHLAIQMSEHEIDINALRARVASCIDSHFGPVRRVLNEYWMDSYWLDEKFFRDKRRCGDSVLKCIRDITEICKFESSKIILKKTDEISCKLKNLENEKFSTDQTCIRTSEKIKLFENDMDRLEKEYFKFCESIESSLNQGKLFKKKLFYYYELELNKKRFSIRNELNPISRLVLMISSVLIGKEKQKLFATE